jgi:hypothetical protein
MLLVAADAVVAAGGPPPACGLARRGSPSVARRAYRPALRSRSRCGAARCCTTEGSNTHKTETREVHYRWHPWYGRQVLVQGIRHRRGVVVLNCRADVDGASPVLEVPEWMFDSSVCGRVKQAGTSTVDCRALHALKILLASRFCIKPAVQNQHHSVIAGGADEKESEVERDSVPVVPAAPAESGSARRNSSEDRAPAGANAAPARGPRLRRRSCPGGEQ